MEGCLRESTTFLWDMEKTNCSLGFQVVVLNMAVQRPRRRSWPTDRRVPAADYLPKKNNEILQRFKNGKKHIAFPPSRRGPGPLAAGGQGGSAVAGPPPRATRLRAGTVSRWAGGSQDNRLGLGRGGPRFPLIGHEAHGAQEGWNDGFWDSRTLNSWESSTGSMGTVPPPLLKIRIYGGQKMGQRDTVRFFLLNHPAKKRGQWGEVWNCRIDIRTSNACCPRAPEVGFSDLPPCAHQTFSSKSRQRSLH